MTRAWLATAAVLLGGCDSGPTLTRPSPPPAAYSAPLLNAPRQRIVLGESIDVDLDMNINGVVACEVREDPTPCARLDVEVSRPGTLELRVDFNPVDSMFLYEYQDGPPATWSEAHFEESPLVFRKGVTPGLVHISTGPNVPWGRDGTVRFRVLATLE